MKHTLIILALFLTGCNGTDEYQNYLDTHKTSSRFYCKDKVLVNEFIRPTDTAISYRIPIINNKTVTCDIEDKYIIDGNIGINYETGDERFVEITATFKPMKSWRG